MRVLIVAAVFACACAAPSGLLASPYVAPLPLAPTISPGDVQGAAIDAHVDASNYARASVDAARQFYDQASENHGKAIDAAVENSWSVVDAVKTREAALDGAAAGAAPIVAKQLTGYGYAAPVPAYAAPIYAGAAYAGPVSAYAAPIYAGAAYAAPIGYGARAAYGFAHAW